MAGKFQKTDWETLHQYSLMTDETGVHSGYSLSINPGDPQTKTGLLAAPEQT